MSVRLNNLANIGRQLRVLVFAPLSGACGEVFQASDPVVAFLQSLLDGLTSPSEASFGLASTALAEFGGDLGLERAALVSGKTLGP